MHIIVHNAVYNTAQNSSDNRPSYATNSQSHHCWMLRCCLSKKRELRRWN